MAEDLQGIRDAQHRALVDGLAEQQRRLEYLIHLTPTGPQRNAYCDANIHVSATLNALRDIP